MLKLTFLGALFLFQSCHIQIENNRRIVVKGSVADAAGNPIENISIFTKRYGETLGASISDANGNFQFVSLEAEGSGGLSIMVNLKPSNYGYDDYYYNSNQGYNSEQLQNADFSGTIYFNDDINRTRSIYDLGQIQLNKIAALKLILKNSPGDANTISYSLEYAAPICQIDVNAPNGQEECQIIDDYYPVLDPTSENVEINLESQLGTNVLFKYQLNNQPEQTVSIPLTNPQNSYVFEY